MGNEKYMVLLEELAGLIQAKNSRIDVLNWQIADLQKKLEDAEARNANVNDFIERTLRAAEMQKGEACEN